ncbi:MAG: type II secretion system F family protein [Thermoplasmata archaeon]|nr:MAG: type II secretion system F family protein [Thermoplasmata archaeon]
MAPEDKSDKIKKIKAIKETNWLAISVGVAILISALFVVLAFLAQIEVIDFEGSAEVVFEVDDNGNLANPVGVIDNNDVRVMVIDGERITYYTLTDMSISESQANDFINEGGHVLRTLPIDRGYELGKPPEKPLRLDGDVVNFIILALIPIFAIPGVYIMRTDRNIKQIEDRLPDFLRDVAEAGRFGMTLADAIVVASGGRYGKLTPEIKKMAARIDWGVPANEAIKLFSDKVKTPLVDRVSAIIMKSNDAGGNVADVLTLVANDTKQVQLMDKERKVSMSNYIAVIYISFFVFLFTIIILNITFLPQMREAGEETEALVSEEGAEGTVQIIQAQSISAIQFTYLIASLAHAIGDGLIAGNLSTGRIKNGLVHSFILLVCAFMLLRFIEYL